MHTLLLAALAATASPHVVRRVEPRARSLARRSPDRVAFAVLLAGPGVPGREFLSRQTRLSWSVAGVPPDAIERWGGLFDVALDGIVAGASSEEITETLLAIGVDQRRLGGGATSGAELRAELSTQAERLSSAWMRSFLAHDPVPDLEALGCPVLAVDGTLDVHVWHEQNLDAIESAIRGAGGDVTAIRYPGLDHLFEPARSGVPSEYADIERTFDEGVLDDLVEWLRAKVGSRGSAGGDGRRARPE